jgi:hypothetical protein
MEHVLIVALAIAFLALLISRIHFHFSFDLTISRRGATDTTPLGASRATIRRERERAACPGEALPAIHSIQDRGVTKALETASASAEADLASALVNLGCKRPKACVIAKLAMQQASDFDGRLKWAIRQAA